MKLEELVVQLKSAYGDALETVVLYGSAVAGEHIARKSDYNVLVIVRSLPLERLRAVAAATRAWTGAGNPAPMTFTDAEWRASSDIFPMEYADILERHKVLFGSPPFDGITVKPHELRLEVEQQAMGKLLHLRKESMAAGGDTKNQLALLSASLSALMVVFRGVSRLLGTPPSQDYEVLSADIASRAGFSAEPFVRVVRHVRGGEKLPSEHVEATLAGYLAGMERLVSWLNEYRS